MLPKRILLLLLMVFAAAQAFGVSVYEPFDYPVASNLAGQGGWVLTAGTSPKIQAGSLATPGLMPATEGKCLVFGNSQMEVRRFMKNEVAPAEFSGNYWYALAFKATDLGSLNTNVGLSAAFSLTD